MPPHQSSWQQYLSLTTRPPRPRLTPQPPRPRLTPQSPRSRRPATLVEERRQRAAQAPPVAMLVCASAQPATVLYLRHLKPYVHALACQDCVRGRPSPSRAESRRYASPRAVDGGAQRPAHCHGYAHGPYPMPMPSVYAHVHLLTHRPFQCPCPWAKLLQLPHALSSRDAHACVSPTAQLFAPLEYGDSEAAALHVTGTWRKLAHEGKQTKEEEFHVQATSTPELSRCQA